MWFKTFNLLYQSLQTWLINPLDQILSNTQFTHRLIANDVKLQLHFFPKQTCPIHFIPLLHEAINIVSSFKQVPKKIWFLLSTTYRSRRVVLGLALEVRWIFARSCQSQSKRPCFPIQFYPFKEIMLNNPHCILEGKLIKQPTRTLPKCPGQIETLQSRIINSPWPPPQEILPASQTPFYYIFLS